VVVNVGRLVMSQRAFTLTGDEATASVIFQPARVGYHQSRAL
jgi:hypothetical protein